MVIGAGGLGSPAALYLAAAGVGTIGVVDMDIVEESNLQRQILHSTETVGKNKVDSAEKTLSEEKQYSAVMAATGLLYLAILTGFGMDLVARATLA